MNVDIIQLLRIYRAVGGPTAERNVDKAVAIIRNGGKIPELVYPEEKRTYYRIKERLKEHGLL